jgi:hypothetical protein
MSDEILNRILELASKGYDVRFLYYYGDAIQVRVSKNGHHAARVMSMDQLVTAKFNALLYAINRLVEVIDETCARYKD